MLARFRWRGTTEHPAKSSGRIRSGEARSGFRMRRCCCSKPHDLTSAADLLVSRSLSHHYWRRQYRYGRRLHRAPLPLGGQDRRGQWAESASRPKLKVGGWRRRQSVIQTLPARSNECVRLSKHRLHASIRTRIPKHRGWNVVYIFSAAFYQSSPSPPPKKKRRRRRRRK